MTENTFKGIFSRNMEVCFWVPFDRSEVAIPLTERVRLLLKFSFCVEFLIFASRRI
jgi:hypothetical protein